MKLNYKELRTGDVYFCSALTGSHCGQIITPYGEDHPLFYGCEMTTDFMGRHQFKISSLKKKPIIAIKRPMMAYSTRYNQNKLISRMLDFKFRHAIGYTVQELSSELPLVSNHYNIHAKNIDASFVYSNLVIDGEPIRNEYFDDYVSTADLYSHPLMRDVKDWKATK